MAPYSVPLFASPSKMVEQPHSCAVLGGGLRQPLTPDAFERLPQLLTAASSDEDICTDDALCWRGGLQYDYLQRLGAAEDRPGWDVQASTASISTAALSGESQAAGRCEPAPPATAAQQLEGALAAACCHAVHPPAAMQWDAVHGGGNASEMVGALEHTVAQQAVLAMQVRETCIVYFLMRM